MEMIPSLGRRPNFMRAIDGCAWPYSSSSIVGYGS
eukprot:SAG31_NODE_2207_length_6189_cov_5.894253_1_plen_35_part_00